ncbi:MAG TPA: redox-sensing transcriptional repressor Rex [Clostridiales bacterium]|nr:redox-sensing transcriptional repressor Rex [Clostridiales bacterium]
MSKEKNRISEAVIRRMPKYYRYLKEMRENGVKRISSRELSKKMGLTASQIRQDFNCFGGFGQQGYGYNVDELYEEIQKILGLDREYNMIVIGAGNLGQALANYSGFEQEGFKIRALFDINPRLVGISIRGIPILDIDQIENFLSKYEVHIAAICTPKKTAQEIVDKLVECGVKGIWNFAPVDVDVPDDVVVENVHLSDTLYTISLRMNANYE